jgi:hypothetical protein
MTRNGFLMSISRHGFNKLNAPLARASFEEMVDNILEAAMSAEVDPMRDVISNICVGQRTPIGTGKVHPIVKDWYLEEALQQRTVHMEERSVITTDLHQAHGHESRETAQTQDNYDDILDDWDYPVPPCTNPFQHVTLPSVETRPLPVVEQPEIKTDTQYENQLEPVFLLRTDLRNLSEEVDESFGPQNTGGYEFRPSSPLSKREMNADFSFHPSSPQPRKTTTQSPRGNRTAPGTAYCDATEMSDIDKHDSMLPWEKLQSVEVVQPHPDRQADPARVEDPRLTGASYMRFEIADPMFTVLDAPTRQDDSHNPAQRTASPEGQIPSR